MRRTRIKVCGMRDHLQVTQAINLGVDAIGMIFFQSSPRNISIEQAKNIRAVVPAFVSLVGVFVDHSAEEINTISTEVNLDIVQLHGDQDVDFANKVRRPYIKVIRVADKDSVEIEAKNHHNAQALLLDTFSVSEYGGTGHRIPNVYIPAPMPKYTILAGGINANNIDEVLQMRPYAVDVNSGVELSPGNKDISQLKRVIQKIRKFDLECRESEC